MRKGGNMFEIRKAKAADIPVVEEMAAMLFPNGRMRALPGDIFLIADKGGIPVGFCHYRIRENSCYIAGLGVLAQYREHGAGSQLLAEALYRIDKKGVQKTFLKVRAVNNAAKLYLGFGFFEKKMGDTLVLVRKRQN